MKDRRENVSQHDDIYKNNRKTEVETTKITKKKRTQLFYILALGWKG